MNQYFLTIITFLSICKMNQSQNSTTIMPAIFIGHGNPMNALYSNQITKGWQKLAQSILKPKAIVCVSAHWETNNYSYVTSMQKPKTIHDFGGFAQQLHQMQYPAPGSPELAKQIVNKLSKFNVKEDNSKWGLDHGTWCVLIKMYPKADIPVLQVSLNRQYTTKEHYQFGRNLGWLRRNGVLIIGSGNIVHNLGALDWQNPNTKYPWAQKVHTDVHTYIKTRQHDKLINYKANGPQFIKAINSTEHYLPFLYILALQEQNQEVVIFNDVFDMGSIMMACYVVTGKDGGCLENFK